MFPLPQFRHHHSQVRLRVRSVQFLSSLRSVFQHPYISAFFTVFFTIFYTVSLQRYHTNPDFSGFVICSLRSLSRSMIGVSLQFVGIERSANSNLNSIIKYSFCFNCQFDPQWGSRQRAPGTALTGVYLGSSLDKSPKPSYEYKLFASNDICNCFYSCAMDVDGCTSVEVIVTYNNALDETNVWCNL